MLEQARVANNEDRFHEVQKIEVLNNPTGTNVWLVRV